ncbi:MAG: YitT family protein [Spirochaetales bacterium]|nr:YitT family protein [Candidatus Physcosoma equi]
MMIGPFVAACGVVLFYVPAKVTSGGASGIANILYNLFGFDVGTTSFCVNLPLICLGMFVFGLKYGLKTLIGSTLMSFWMTMIAKVTHYQALMDISEPVNILLSAVFGGLLLGSGIAITMKSGCNTGGVDVIAQTIGHFFPIRVGSISFCFNAVIVGSSAFLIGVQPMLFSIIAMFCSSYMVNYVLTGFGTGKAKSVYIVSEHHQVIIERVFEELHRGGTLIDSVGAYSHAEMKMLLVLVPNHQYQKLIRIVNEEDPNAFVIVNEAYNVLGKGFVPLKKIANATTAED